MWDCSLVLSEKIWQQHCLYSWRDFCCTLILPLSCNTSHSTLWVSCLNKIQIKYYFAYQQSDMTGHITNCITVYMQIRVRLLQPGGWWKLFCNLTAANARRKNTPSLPSVFIVFQENGCSGLLKYINTDEKSLKFILQHSLSSLRHEEALCGAY